MEKIPNNQSNTVTAGILVASVAASVASVVTIVTSLIVMRRVSQHTDGWPATDYRRRSILDVTRAAPVRHAAAVPPENPHSPPTPPLGNPQVRR